MLRALALVAALVVAQFLASPMAAAAVNCGKGKVWDGTTCTVVVGGGGGGGGGGGSSRKCVYEGKTIPCTKDGASWSATNQCYMALLSPQPPKSDPVWEGHTDGAIFGCYGINTEAFALWAPTADLPDPEDLARQAVASMNLLPIQIGIVPEARQGRVGLVGLPVWLWVDQPSDSTWGPISRTASASGYSITATAKVSHIRWEMGDGKVVSCSNRGTVYADRYGTQQSPTCGYAGYTKDGTYTVRATSYWEVTWAGMGESGTITFNLTRTAQITVGELQVVNR